ncbi:MAG: PAS domain S-box protein [Phycisphaeraceae bacterium]
MPASRLARTRRLEPYARALLGPSVTALAVLVCETLTPALNVDLSSTAVVLSAVVFATMISGLAGGLASAAIATVYYAHLLLGPAPELPAVLWFAQLTLTTFLLAGLVHGLLHYAVERQRLETNRVERALARSERDFRLIADNTSDIVHAWGLDGELLYVNRAFETITGHPVGTFEQTGIAGVAHPDDAARVRELHERALAGHAIAYAEFRIVTRVGAVRWLAGNWGPLRDDAGRRVGVQARHYDMTGQKLAEQKLRALNETLEQRVAERTGQLQAAARDLNQAEQRERQRLASVLHDHLQQLLVASRLRVSLIRGREPRKELDELDELLGQCIDASRSLTMELSPPIRRDTDMAAALGLLARSMREKHGLVVEVMAMDSPGPERMPEDTRIFLFNATRELLFNAVKHAGIDRARVVLTCPAADCVAVCVEDDGAGFDPEQLRRRLAEDAHYGLSSILHRLELLGGHMEIDSAPGRGARITLHTPLTPAPATPATTPATAAAGVQPQRVDAPC